MLQWVNVDTLFIISFRETWESSKSFSCAWPNPLAWSCDLPSSWLLPPLLFRHFPQLLRSLCFLHSPELSRHPNWTCTSFSTPLSSRTSFSMPLSSRLQKKQNITLAFRCRRIRLPHLKVIGCSPNTHDVQSKTPYTWSEIKLYEKPLSKPIT